jgi:hypothetical protein
MEDFIAQVRAGALPFSEIIGFIESKYRVQPTGFQNGAQYNPPTQNQGSAKVLYFAQLQGLSEEDTLLLFAEHYRSVLDTPEGTDHQNIRQFQQEGWNGVRFEGVVLE